ncbi:MAG: triose-phosphate isomerase [Polyangiales bacterium]
MTSPARRPLIAGNWKLHRDLRESVELARAVADGARIGPRTDVVVAPVFTALHAVSQALRGTRVQVSAQDVYWEKQGAFTGEVSAAMLRDVGCAFGIVGHSERRQLFGETDANVHKKMRALQAEGLTPIACLGETLGEREGGVTYEVLRRQLEGMLGGVTGGEAARVLDGLVLAYEPVWAIGTGRTAKSADAQLAHGFLRDRLRSMHGDLADGVRILYGGSVKADNAAEILAQPDIDGVLVGGASLDAAGFARIIQAAG